MIAKSVQQWRQKSAHVAVLKKTKAYPLMSGVQISCCSLSIQAIPLSETKSSSIICNEIGHRSVTDDLYVVLFIYTYANLNTNVNDNDKRAKLKV